MIRVMVAEDMRILREALVTLLEMEEDIDVVTAVSSGDEIDPAARRHRPDVAVLDIDLPGRDGITAADGLRESLPSCRVLILTALGRPANLRRGLSVGVAGFLLKDAPPDQLVAAIRTVAGGGMVVDPQLAYTTLAGERCPLTERELDVLRLTAEGLHPRQVATQLHLGYGTVRNYLGSAVTKLGARNRIDAIRIATDAGWL